jgi:leucyl-tRNA synthetase
MAVPAHDERDFEFANVNGLEVKQVVAPADGSAVELPYTSEGVTINSGDFTGSSSEDTRNQVMEKLASMEAGGAKITYKLRDWVFSRQRYWGEPIPIYFPVVMTSGDDNEDPRTGAAHSILFDTPIPVPEEQLPLKLPDMVDFQPGDDPLGCLARAKDWRYFKEDGKWFARETNTMPQWAGSCWYYLRFTDPKNTQQAFGSVGASWLPVDLYVGGQEHAVLHLLYARFWHKVLFDLGIVDHNEPFRKLVHQGMILGMDGEKMSKSRGNVINPDDVVKEHGADALRLYEMFMGPLEATKPWQTGQLQGVVRFREKVYSLVTGDISSAAPEGEMQREMHKTIKKVTQDIDQMSFNTAISALMIFTNLLLALKAPVPKKALETLVHLLSPFAPHIAEECWLILGNTSERGLSYEAWPKFEEALCVDTTAVVAIQVNGKVRAKLEMDKDLSEVDAIGIALQQASVAKFMDGKPIKKAIYVPGRILNIVVG